MSTTAITKTSVAQNIERVLIGGDLSGLKPEERLQYYKAVCESVGLNPLTKPFDYLNLSGKLVLYAKRDATDQLRKIHGVSITALESKNVHEVYVVTAKAQDKDGRTDCATGAVNLGTLQGDALANALMKAETKAKRRVTLSICGLGLLDETEVETIPDAAPAQEEKKPPVSAPTQSPQAQTKPTTILINGKISNPKQTDKGIWFELSGKQVFAPFGDVSTGGIHNGDECELEVVPSKTKKGVEYFRMVRVAAVVKDDPDTITQDDIDDAAATLFQEKAQ